MTKTILLAAIVASLATTTGTARAGGSQGAIGVGAEVQINGTGGASLNYDAGKFHVGGFLGVRDPVGPSNTDLSVGGRFFYHVHSTSQADFGLGGSLGIVSDANGPGMNRSTLVFIEPSFQIRMFVVSNVALSFTGGLVIGASDAQDNLEVGGQVTGLAGFHYYFF